MIYAQKQGVSIATVAKGHFSLPSAVIESVIYFFLKQFSLRSLKEDPFENKIYLKDIFLKFTMQAGVISRSRHRHHSV